MDPSYTHAAMADRRCARRDILKGGCSLWLGLAFAPAAYAQDDRASARPKEGDRLVKANDASKTPLKPGDIAVGAAQTLAWAIDPADGTVRSGSRLNQVILVRLDPARLTPETRANAADGVVAYTVICTHSGCDVDDWLADDQVLSCSCHASAFDPKDGGKVLDGPAPRALPALPLTIVDGLLVVAKPFTSRVGFEPG